MNILVTGSAGFVGSYLVPTLQKFGHFVFGIDKKNENQSNSFYQYDLREQNEINISYDFDLCIHLASDVGGILHNTKQQSILVDNIEIDNTVMKLCLDNNCESVIFFSTINVFEDFNFYKHEKLNRRSIYADSKVVSERVFEDSFRNLIVIRPTNIFGKKQLATHDNYGESHVIPDILNKIDGFDRLELMGDGSQVRNFVHVQDICNFVAKNIEISGSHYFNLRSNITKTILELAYDLMDYKNKTMEIDFIEEYMRYEKINIKDFCMKIPENYGWVNTINSIKEGLEI